MNDSLQSPTLHNPHILIPVNPLIEDYMEGLLHNTNHRVLTTMEAMALQQGFPIIGRIVGVFIHNLAKMINAQRVFEFGSGYGYSAYWFAKAVGETGQVICTDADPHNQLLAQLYLEDADLWERVDFQIGNAQERFEQTDGLFDICYNDVDKGEYPAIWRAAKNRIRAGGLYIADNVLWHGRVAVPDCEDVVAGWTEAVREHNELIFNDPDFDTFINPSRDGVIVARRKT
jgi:predicted O-methyltransferase YrrM